MRPYRLPDVRKVIVTGDGFKPPTHPTIQTLFIGAPRERARVYCWCSCQLSYPVKLPVFPGCHSPLFHAAKKLPKKTAPGISPGSIRGYFTHHTAATIRAAAERDGSICCLQSNGGGLGLLPRCVNIGQLSTPAGLRHPKKRTGLR